jgi:hypothetical protein
LAAFKTFLCLACPVTPRLTRAMADLLTDSVRRLSADGRRWTAAGDQPFGK